MLESPTIVKNIKGQVRAFLLSLILTGYWILLGSVASGTIRIIQDLFTLELTIVAWFITLLCVALYGGALYFTVIVFKIIKDSKA